MNQVRNWLEQLGFGQYADAFAQNEIGWEALPELDHEILKELGVKLIGHRMSILKAAKLLRADNANQATAESVASAEATRGACWVSCLR